MGWPQLRPHVNPPPPAVLTQEPPGADLRLAGPCSPWQTLRRGALASVSNKNGFNQKAGDKANAGQTGMGTDRSLCLALFPHL